jgi:hypothetical protein
MTHGTTAKYIKAHYAVTALSPLLNAHMRRSTSDETKQARQASSFCLNTYNLNYGCAVLHNTPPRVWQMPSGKRRLDMHTITMGAQQVSDQDSISWGELAQLTHATQVERFNWCSCEEKEQFPYNDCPR